MAARRAERLVNLVICLLSTRQFLTAERIRDAVPGYEPADGEPKHGRGVQAHVRARQGRTARSRHPARDRPQQPLRQRGRLPDHAARDYELPPIEFDAAEAAAVGLAARLWQSATLGEPARAALIKLRAGGHRRRRRAGRRAPSPHVDASDPSLPALLDAARTAPRRALRLPQVRFARIRRAPHARALGRAVVAAALVRRGSRPRPRRAAQLPAVAHRRHGRGVRRGRGVRAAPRRRPARHGGRTAVRGRPHWPASACNGGRAGASLRRIARRRRATACSPITFSDAALAGSPGDRRCRDRARRCSTRRTSIDAVVERLRGRRRVPAMTR